MYEIGQYIIYGENGVCTVDAIGPLSMRGSDKDRIYYTLSPYVGTGTFYAPVDTKVYMEISSRQYVRISDLLMWMRFIKSCFRNIPVKLWRRF